ncbi:ATP-dependent Clp protease adaptor protein ClpS [compost metagenome]
MSDTITVPVRPPSGAARSRHEDRPLKVILWNDDVNDFMHVIVTLVRMTCMSLEQAQSLTLAAHLHGSAVVAETYRERAEFYREQLEAHGLTSTIE